MIDGLNASSTILDLGANRGSFSLAMAKRFHCKPLCVEADPRLFPALESNPNLSAINAAVASRGGTSRFYLADNWECSSLIPSASRSANAVECRAVTLETLLATMGTEQVDLLKVDIEGLEVELLTSLQRPILDRINQLTVEFHESIGIGTVKQVLETIDYLRSFGFAVVRGSFFDYSDVLFLHPERLKMQRNWRWFALAEKLRNGISRRLLASVQ
jgi:FkbM family methyltransferase